MMLPVSPRTTTKIAAANAPSMCSLTRTARMTRRILFLQRREHFDQVAIRVTEVHRPDTPGGLVRRRVDEREAGLFQSSVQGIHVVHRQDQRGGVLLAAA